MTEDNKNLILFGYFLGLLTGGLAHINDNWGFGLAVLIVFSISLWGTF